MKVQYKLIFLIILFILIGLVLIGDPTDIFYIVLKQVAIRELSLLLHNVGKV